MDSLAGKVVLITGASTGIGGFTARYMSKFKPKLVLVARSTDKLKQIQQLCEEGGSGKGNVLTITADVAKYEDLGRIISETITAFGQLDVLVNNAASVVFFDIESTTLESYEHLMAVNLRAPFFLSQAALPHLKKTKGNIINISSVSTDRPFPFTAAYCISKAGLDCLTRILAFDVARDGVRVNTVGVGVTLTDTQVEILKLAGKELDAKAGYPGVTDYQPLGGTCSMEDVAKVVTFLASDLSAAMTGSYIPVDRGHLLLSHCSHPEVMKKYRNAGFVNSGDQTTTATEERLKNVAAATQFYRSVDIGAKPPESDRPAQPSQD